MAGLLHPVPTKIRHSVNDETAVEHRGAVAAGGPRPSNRCRTLAIKFHPSGIKKLVNNESVLSDQKLTKILAEYNMEQLVTGPDPDGNLVSTLS